MSRLVDTIKTDLHAGVSWLEQEAEIAALDVWNVVKGVFVALEPVAAQILLDAVKAAVTAAESGHSIEEIATAVLNTGKAEVIDAAKSAGPGLLQVLVASVKASGINLKIGL